MCSCTFVIRVHSVFPERDRKERVREREREKYILLPVNFLQVQKIWFDASWSWTSLGDTQPLMCSVTHGLYVAATLVSRYQVCPTSVPTARRSSVTCKNRPSTTMTATRSWKRRNDERNDARTSQAQHWQLSETEKKQCEEWCKNMPKNCKE